MNNTPNTNVHKQTVLFAIISLLVMAVIVLGLYAYSLQNKVEEAWETNEDKDEKLVLLHQQLDSFQIELTQRMLYIKQLGGKTDSLEIMISQIQQDKNELVAKNQFNYRRYIEIKAKKQQYIAEIQLRDEEIELLITENKKLKKQNKALQTDIQRRKNSVAESRIQIDSLQSLQDKANKRLEQASRLKAYHINIEAINKRGKIRQDTRYRSKQAMNLRITYLIVQNKAAEEKNYQTTIKIKNAEGKIISQYPAEKYTVAHNFAYKGNDTEIEILYEREERFDKGIYLVEVYIDDYKAGSTTFEIY
ncbi:MAG: hypothetical protein JJT94_06810 [Bernardetiaceae bacterium]|nr:hypothetical protein [Bernardetiaceae bacterium]